ncbi:MAG: hypothetical protein WBB75_16420 [Sphingobacterium siyangense]
MFSLIGFIELGYWTAKFSSLFSLLAVDPESEGLYGKARTLGKK